MHTYIFGRGERVKYQLVNDHLLESMFKELFKKKKARIDDIVEDIQYVDLVFPPESTPPTKDSVNKMNIIGICNISHKL